MIFLLYSYSYRTYPKPLFSLLSTALLDVMKHRYDHTCFHYSLNTIVLVMLQERMNATRSIIPLVRAWKWHNFADGNIAEYSDFHFTEAKIWFQPRNIIYLTPLHELSLHEARIVSFTMLFKNGPTTFRIIWSAICRILILIQIRKNSGRFFPVLWLM